MSDTSPVRALAHLRLLELLDELYGEVFIPPAVQRELENHPDESIRVDVAEFHFIHVESPRDEERARQFRQVLDPGESEALALALEKHADAVLIDEAAGRKTATEVGLTVIGTLDILLRAKQKNLLTAIRPLLKDLEEELGFFISDELRGAVLKLANE